MRFILIIIIFLILSCASEKKTVIEFDNLYAKNYNSMIKWKRIEKVSVFFKDTKDYIRTTDKYKDINIEKFKILDVKKITEYKYRILVERSEVAIDSNILKDNRYYQYWLYDSNKNSWYIKEEMLVKQEDY